MVDTASDKTKTSDTTARLIDHVEVAIEVVLGEAKMTVAELAELNAGTVVALDRQLNEAAEIRVNKRVIARGEVVSVDDRFAVRITEVG